jgi:hypothetical protein
MTQLKLAKFTSCPERAVGLMTLDDAWFLISQGLLDIEGAKYLFPRNAWEFLPQKQNPAKQNPAPHCLGDKTAA